MPNKKRKHHYVFQAYLDAWATEAQVWSMRFDGKPFKTSINNVAQQRDFYRTKPLNQYERDFILAVLPIKDRTVEKAFIQHIDTYLQPLEMQNRVSLIGRIIKSQFGENVPDEIIESLGQLEMTADAGVNNVEEDYFSDIEGEGVKWLRLLLQENIDFYYDSNLEFHPTENATDIPFNFLFFLCTQYFRTKAIKERWISSFEPCLSDPRLRIPKGNINLENIAHHVFWFCKSTCAFKLRKAKAHLTLLVNKSTIPLITADQPIINIKGNYSKLDEAVTELMFYYPLSPNIAITVNDDNKTDRIEINESKVEEYNKAIACSAHEFLFANKENVLGRYRLHL